MKKNIIGYRVVNIYRTKSYISTHVKPKTAYDQGTITSIIKSGIVVELNIWYCESLDGRAEADDFLIWILSAVLSLASMNFC